MFLYLVQHGEAKKEEEDPERGLTEQGRRDAGAVASYAATVGLSISTIFHSPKRRAQQTAQIFAGHLKPEKGIELADNLLPGDDPGLWALRIAGINDNVMLVGHLPYLARLAGLLLTGQKEKTPVDFKMGGVLCLKRLEKGDWAVAWMVVPEIVR